ncbi:MULTISPECIES: DUF7144 family membrane protein [Streptomyces]|uniref:DUF7144 domain-containing protein n=1 Tax=Streptomyces chilikensis TaxID=1194079 RepID=A0ABV3ETK9_9ACTN|nr:MULTISPECIES: hypothetical protein [Streptomyces]MDH6224425.1 hypothetical protein [Streptomyces sp. MJP52]
MDGQADTGNKQLLAEGGITFAGVLLGVSGAVTVLQGIAAIAGDDVYGRIGSYVFEFTLTGWGVAHLVIGVLLLVTGVGVLGGRAWARAVGLVLAVISLIEQFLFLPYAPVWSVLLIALDVFVVWALAAYRPAR